MRAVAFVVVALLAANAFAQAPAGDVKKMGETHSGNAAGIVKPATSGTKGSEKKIGMCFVTHSPWLLIVM